MADITSSPGNSWSMSTTKEVSGSDPTFTSNLDALVAISVLFAVVTLFTIMANITVIIALMRSHRLQTRRSSNTYITKLLMVSMAVTDAIVSVFIMPLSIYKLINNGRWYLPSILCIIVNTCYMYFCTASIYHVTCMAVDRYLAICKPLVYRRLTIRTGYLMIGISWMVPLIVILFYLLDDVQTTNSVCETDQNKISLLLCIIIAVYIPVFVVFVIYTVVLVEIRKFHRRKPRQHDQDIPNLRPNKTSDMEMISRCCEVDDVESMSVKAKSNSSVSICTTATSSLMNGRTTTLKMQQITPSLNLSASTVSKVKIKELETSALSTEKMETDACRPLPTIYSKTVKTTASTDLKSVVPQQPWPTAHTAGRNRPSTTPAEPLPASVKTISQEASPLPSDATPQEPSSASIGTTLHEQAHVPTATTTSEHSSAPTKTTLGGTAPPQPSLAPLETILSELSPAAIETTSQPSPAHLETTLSEWLPAVIQLTISEPSPTSFKKIASQLPLASLETILSESSPAPVKTASPHPLPATPEISLSEPPPAAMETVSPKPSPAPIGKPLSEPSLAPIQTAVPESSPAPIGGLPHSPKTSALRVSLRGVLKQSSDTTEHSQSGSTAVRRAPRPRNFRGNLKAVVTIGLMLVCFNVCWLPFSILRTVLAYVRTDVPNGVTEFFLVLGYLNSVLNPIVYCYHRSIRKAISDFICPTR